MLLSSHPERDCDLRTEVSLGGRDFLSMPWFLFASGMLQTVFAQKLSKMLCQLLWAVPYHSISPHVKSVWPNSASHAWSLQYDTIQYY
jgi:hypothetical protein